MTRAKRPSRVRTKANEKAIVDGLAEGTPLRQLCRELGISKSEVYSWKSEDAEFAGRFARAREQGFDAIADEVLEIIDDTAERAESRRVRAEYRLKLLAKWDPKRYGERLDHTSSDGSMSPKGLADFYGTPADGDG